MNKDKKVTINLLSIIDIFIVLLTILDTQSIFSVASQINLHFRDLTILFLIMRLALSFKHFYRIKRYLILFLVSWVGYIFIYSIVSPGKETTLYFKFVVLFSLFFLYFDVLFSEKEGIKKLLKYYSSLIFLIASISLIFWIFGSQLHLLKPTGTIPFYWGMDRAAHSYFGIYFEWQNDAMLFGRKIFRNIGIFTEGPMYSLHLTVAFLFRYLFLEKRSNFILAILILTIITTFSVTGVLAVLFTLTLKVFFKEFEIFRETGKFSWIVLILPLIAILALLGANRLFVNKLSTASGSSRLQDYITGFKAWKVHPFFGEGFGNTDVRKRFMTIWRLSRAQDGFTNSIMSVLGEGGIYFFLSFFFALFGNIIRYRQSSNILIFYLIFLFLFLTTTFAHTSLMIVFLAISFHLLLRQRSLREKN